MAERKNLTIIEVKPVEKVGDKQIPKLSFKAKDGEKELWYSSFRTSLFDAVKQGATIDADIEVKSYERDGESRLDRRLVQVYVNGQPLGGQKQRYGKSPEELDQQARLMVLAYAKDLAVADKIPGGEITKQAGLFYNWVKGNGKAPEPKPETEKSSETKTTDEDWEKMRKEAPTTNIQNITEFKGLLSKHKVATREAYEILSINSFMELVDLDEAWEKVKEAKNI